MTKQKYNTDAQKESFKNYQKRNDLVMVSFRVTREQRTGLHMAAIRAGKSLVKYLMDLSEAGGPQKS